MSGKSLLKPHAVQQLLLAGNIQGTTQEGKTEADGRAKHLQNKLEGRPVDWHDIVDELEDLRSENMISENTYLQLVNAAKKAHEAGSVPPAPQPQINDTSEAEAMARWMGWGGS